MMKTLVNDIKIKLILSSSYNEKNKKNESKMRKDELRGFTRIKRFSLNVDCILSIRCLPLRKWHLLYFTKRISILGKYLE